MQHLEEDTSPHSASHFTLESQRMYIWLNWCLMDRLWKLGLMFFRWEICGKHLGPLGKGDNFANRTSANTRVKVVQDSECWACFSGVDPVFLEWLSKRNCCWNPTSAVKWVFQSTLLISRITVKVTFSYSPLIFLSMWLLIRLSGLLPVYQDPVKQIKLYKTSVMFINKWKWYQFRTRQVALGFYLSLRIHVLQGGTLQVLACVLKVSSNLGPLEFIFLHHGGHYPSTLWSAMAQIIWIITPSFRTLDNAVGQIWYCQTKF